MVKCIFTWIQSHSVLANSLHFLPRNLVALHLVGMRAGMSVNHTQETITNRTEADVAQPAAASTKKQPGGLNRPARWFALRRDIPAWGYRVLATVGFITLMLGWDWLSHSGFINPVFLTTPGKVWHTTLALLGDPTLWLDIKISFLRVTGGFLLAADWAGSCPSCRMPPSCCRQRATPNMRWCTRARATHRTCQIATP